MTALELAERLVKHFEGCCLSAYQDGGGTWTIGYGHTGVEVHSGSVVTQEQADSLLAADLAAAERHLAQSNSTHRGEAADAALIDFTFNLGEGALHQLLAHGEDVPAQFDRWVHDAGKVGLGLVKRRAVEAFLYELGDL